MEVSFDGIHLITKWVDAHRYQQPDGTIGVRHTLSAKELQTGEIRVSPYTSLPFRGGLSLQEVRDVLRTDVHEYEKVVNKLVRVEISQSTFDTLVAFCLLVGKRDFIHSTFIDRINAGEPVEQIAAEITELVEAFKE
jgi:GH24 family phage-related lysozyme (muramidase)